MLNKVWDPKTARILCTLLIFALGLAFLYGARNTLTLFLFAILFAYFIDPLVSRLETPLRKRVAAIAAVYLILIAVLVGLGFLVGPKIAEQGNALATSLPSLLDKAGSGELVSQVGESHGWSDARQAQIQNFLVSHKDVILGFGRNISEKLAQPARHIWWLVLIPILSVFFLRDGQSIAENLVALGRSQDDRKTLRGIVGDVNV